MAEATEFARRENVDTEIQSIHSSTSTSSHDNVDVEKQESDDGESDRIELGATKSVRDPGMEKGVIGKVLSRVSTKSSWKDPGPPPDGGWGAWAQGSWTPFLVFGDSFCDIF